MNKLSSNLYLAVILFTVVVACDTQEPEPLIEAESSESELSFPVNLFQEHFNLDNFDDPVNEIVNNITIDWEKYTSNDIEGTLWYEFEITKMKPIDLKANSGFTIKTHFKLIASLDANDSPVFYILKFIPGSASTNNHFSYVKPQDLHDTTVMFFNMNGMMDFIEYYEKGVPKNTVINKQAKANPLTKASIYGKCTQRVQASTSRCNTANSCMLAMMTGNSGGCGGGGYAMMRTDHYTDWYKVYMNGTREYTHTQFNGSSYQYIWVANSNGGTKVQNGYNYYHYNSNDPTNGQYSNNSPDSPKRIILDISMKNTKALCVYNKLNNLSNGFRNAIKKFDGDFPVSHLKIKIDPTMTSNTLKGITNPHKGFIIEIVLNGNSTKDASYQKRPPLMVAKTIIHEVIHAEMWRKIMAILDNGGSLEGINKSQWRQKLSNGDFPGIFDYYTRFGVNGFQHPLMAAHYRDILARTLQEFDTGNTVSNTEQPLQFYKDIAWEGLIYRNDPTWSSLDQSEKNRIKNVISTYINQNLNEPCQ